MPEGPEITYFSTFLKKKLITGAKTYKLNEIKSFTDNPVQIPKDLDLKNNSVGKVLNIDNKGKLLWLEIQGSKSNYFLHIHYGLTGWLTFDEPESNIKFKFNFISNNEEKQNQILNLYMEDKRRLSKVAFYTPTQHDKIISKLGIDIFSEQFSIENFKNIFETKNTMVASLLLKQEIFCGIGNYIKNEALYLSDLRAKIKTSELTQAQIVKLYNNILFVAYSNLMEMLSNSKITKYLDKSKQKNLPTKLEIPYEYKIYGRETTSDGKKVFKIKVGGRDSYCIKELC